MDWKNIIFAIFLIALGILWSVDAGTLRELTLKHDAKHSLHKNDHLKHIRVRRAQSKSFC